MLENEKVEDLKNVSTNVLEMILSILECGLCINLSMILQNYAETEINGENSFIKVRLYSKPNGKSLKHPKAKSGKKKFQIFVKYISLTVF